MWGSRECPVYQSRKASWSDSDITILFGSIPNRYEILLQVELLFRIKRRHHSPLVVNLACYCQSSPFGRDDVSEFDECFAD